MFVVGDGGSEDGMGERLVERGGSLVDRESGEMELCSLNMDVIFRAEQKERRGTSERVRAGEGRRIWDAERIGDRGEEDRGGCCWILSVLRPSAFVALRRSRTKMKREER